MIKAGTLTRGNITSIVGAVANDYDGQKCIVPAWRRGMSNVVVSNSGGDYDGGDRVIGQNSYEVDGDLLLTVGWGDGFAIRRLNNDGTMTKLYHNNYALYRDTTSTYNHMHGIAIHKPTSQCIIMSHNVNGYSLIDYSNIKSGGTTVVNDRPPSQYVFSNGANVDRMGTYYTNGLVTAGDWLYVGDYDATHYKKFPRRNWVNGTQELIDATSSTYKYTNSQTIDRNGYRYSLFHDEVNDRVFYCSYYNGNFMLITDASTANPKCVWCDMGDRGLGDDAYETGLFIPDPVSQPNRLVVGCSSRHAYVDISPCFGGSGATVISQYYTEDSSIGARFGCLFRAGTKYQGFDDDAFDKNPIHKDFIPTASDRGRNMLDGWIDPDNNKIVGVYRFNNTTEDTSTGGRGRSYRSDYSSPIFCMKSENNTKYWVKVGYGYDGHGFRIWSNDIGNKLIGNWSIEYGTYTLTNNHNIGFVHINTVDHYTPSQCSLSYYVSNNNGSTWEAYNPDSGGVHYFNSSGTSLKIKYTATGQENKAPYKMSPSYDTILYGDVYDGIKEELPMKVSKFKVRGRKA